MPSSSPSPSPSPSPSAAPSPPAAPELSTEEHILLLASADHNLSVLAPLLRSHRPTCQEPGTLQTPLHKAILGCAGLSGTAGDVDRERLRQAEATVRLLLENGAIWNDLDHEGMTPGCYADKFGLMELYEVMVDAGVRAELLLGRLGGWVKLGDEEGEDEEEEEGGEKGMEVEKDENGESEKRLGQNNTAGEGSPEWSDPTAVTSPEYLSSKLTYQVDKLVDSSSNGIMMAWETDIMRRTAALLLSSFSPPPSDSFAPPNTSGTNTSAATTSATTAAVATSIIPPLQGPRVLNIGFGMGIIDRLFQSHDPPPSKHTIIEAHPDVLCSHLHATSTWAVDPTVEIIPRRWQEALPELVSPSNGDPPRTYDIIYFDTFAEPYSSLRDFFTEYVPLLLDPLRGRFGFFNGLGADRKISYDVYRKVVELDLFEAGLETEWEVVKVPDLVASGEWEGVRRRYWCLDKYWLPVCKIEGVLPLEERAV